MKAEKVSQFLEYISQWAFIQSNIQALALVGSHASGTATETSDVDLVIITDDPDRFLYNLLWIERFGTVHKQQIEKYGLVTSIRVWYDDGLEVEYGITDERWVAVPINKGTQRVIADGMRILFERGDILSRHLLK